MISFAQARKAVPGPTLADGFEDALDYNVLSAIPATDDLVTLVNKQTGKVHQEIFWDVEDRLGRMVPVTE